MLGALFRSGQPAEERLSVNDYLRLWQKFSYGGAQYVVPGGSIQELTALEGAANPIVWACISVRLQVFADARFAFEAQDGVIDEFNRGLIPLKRPFPGGRQRDLLARMEVDASLYGNSYWVRDGNSLQRLNPARVKVLTGSVESPTNGRPWGQTLLGYAVVGDNDNDEIIMFSPDEVAHYRPLPDPHHAFRGQSWLSPVLDDVQADDAMTGYKTAYVRNAAVGTVVVKVDPTIDEDSFMRLKETFNAGHQGVSNAFKTIYVGGGTDVTTLGANLQDLNAKAVQGAGETRIAAAAGVSPVLVGLSESLGGSSLNAGNYGAARRRFADGTIRYLWGAACEALENVVSPPAGRRLWINEKAVLFMQEDVLDAAKVRAADAQTLRTLVDGGFNPQSAIEYVAADNLSKLTHDGKLSVQLQPPADGEPDSPNDQPADDDEGVADDGD